MNSGSPEAILPPPAMGEAVGHAGSGSGAWRQPVWLGAVILLWAGLALTVASSGSPVAAQLFNPVAINSLGLGVVLVAAAFCAMVVHEMGHLAASIVCRFQILTISLGIFRISRGRSGWKVQVRTKRVFTGSVASIPRTNEFWRERMLSVVAAGPAATLVSALLAAWLIQLHQFEGEFILFFLRGFFQVSLLIFTLGLIPNRPSSLSQNDATLFLALWQDKEDANAIFLYHLVVQHQLRGIEPRDFPFWLVELMATFRGRADFMVLYAGILASWAFDRGDQANGNLWDAHALCLSSGANPATRYACLANSACFDLAFRGDVAAARAKLDGIKLDMIASPSLQHRVLAARNLVFGSVAKSLAEVAASRSLLPAELRDRGFDCFFLKRLHCSAISWVVPVGVSPGTR